MPKRVELPYPKGRLRGYLSVVCECCKKPRDVERNHALRIHRATEPNVCKRCAFARRQQKAVGKKVDRKVLGIIRGQKRTVVEPIDVSKPHAVRVSGEARCSLPCTMERYLECLGVAARADWPGFICSEEMI